MPDGAYYNEIDPFAAGWLRNLIAAGRLPAGDVDERSIVDVQPDDLRSYRQCHFFAGLGGWPYALTLAGWPEDREVWTGSCPCQPLSSAGQRKGHADERHLWPAFHRLIAERRPAIVFGEQVASEDGREWLAGVRADLEALGYAVGAADLCAASVGAPHIRQRLWWVADAAGGWRGEPKRFVEADQKRSADAKPEWLRELPKGLSRRGWAGGLGDAPDCGEPHKRGGNGPERQHVSTFIGTTGRSIAGDSAARDFRSPAGDPGEVGFWANADWLPCTDGKARRVEPGTFPLVAGLPKGMGRSRDPSEPFHAAEARIMRLRGYGNSIVPQLAAEFVRAYAESL